jgi:hypothetical protein
MSDNNGSKVREEEASRVLRITSLGNHFSLVDAVDSCGNLVRDDQIPQAARDHPESLSLRFIEGDRGTRVPVVEERERLDVDGQGNDARKSNSG